MKQNDKFATRKYSHTNCMFGFLPILKKIDHEKPKEFFSPVHEFKDKVQTMNIEQIKINLQKLIVTFNKESFIYELLLVYGLPKASIARFKKGNFNLSKVEGEISWKKKLFFKEEQKEDFHLTISQIAKELKSNERFVIIADFKTHHAS